jgi:hypothetical protein
MDMDMNLLKGRVADPEDPYVFKPPESGSGVGGTAQDLDPSIIKQK